MNDDRLHGYMPDYAIPPGETLVELLDSLGMTQHELAFRSGRPVKTINEIIKGKTKITPQTALQFERTLGMPASFWNNLEQNYQDAIARVTEYEKLRANLEWLEQFPVSAMIQAGWIRQRKDNVEQFRELLTFFGIASPNQWSSIFEDKQVAYRQSKTFQNHPFAVVAWLRKGDLDAQQIKCERFDKGTFHEKLRTARSVTLEENPDVFIPNIVDLCASGGVAVTFVRELPGIRISGAARWLSSSKALIQLTLRYKTNDHLWFSFFHEAAHILYDGRREAFLDADKADKINDNTKETRADDFAKNTLIPPNEYEAFYTANNFSSRAVKQFASQIGIAPGIVVGRLQHDGTIPYRSNLNRLKVHYQWTR